ncbi:MAG: hypothetical protein CMN77_14950 [Spirochaetaceae bacterium]|nr:hypothetical protein [Spirochaetaceae bacterium]|tara:strand:+ start:130041 stop:130661 length:621 start_codon:yes stop_codon:yes gene_type:complete
MRIAAYHLHYLLAFIIVIYAFLCLWLDSRLNKKEPISDSTRQAHKQYALTVKVMQYVTIVSLLTGLYLLSFMLKAIENTPIPFTAFTWAYIKVFLFLALTGIMGALGSIPLKKRLFSLENGGHDLELHRSTAKKLQIFKILQLSIVVIMFGLGTYRPGTVTIERVDPSQEAVNPSDSNESESTGNPDQPGTTQNPPAPDGPPPGSE